jgi:cell division protease FtsH
MKVTAIEKLLSLFLTKLKGMESMKNSKKSKKRQIGIIVGITAVASLTGTALAINDYNNLPPLIDYSEYQEYLEEGKVDAVTYSDGEYMTIYLETEETKDMTYEEIIAYDYPDDSMFRTIYPKNADFRKELLEQNVVVLQGSDNFSNFMSKYLFSILEIMFFTGVIISMRNMTKQNNQEYGIVDKPQDIPVEFDDIIGLDEIKGDMELIIKQIKEGKYSKDLPHGVIFAGVGGTGKTMTAKAIAREAGVNFMYVDSSSLIDMYVGLGARKIRKIFKQARDNSPCVVFFDELDAIGRKRGSRGNNAEHEQTINALLTELDGFNGRDNVFVIGATNRVDVLDDALIRSGRFDRIITIDAPKKWETRRQLFDSYLKKGDNYKLAEDVDTSVLAKQTTGFTGADIASIIREAKMIAFGKDTNVLTQEILEEAIDKKVFKGSRSNSEQHQKDKEIVAYHESGHAISTILLGEEVARISVMGMTSGVGGAVFRTDKDKLFNTKQEMENTIKIAYAGRASEEVFFGKENITQGASNDITQATSILYNYVSKLGFNESTGLLDYELLSQNVLPTNDKVVAEMTKLSNRLYSETVQLISENRETVERLAKVLLQKKTLSGENVKKVFDNTYKM